MDQNQLELNPLKTVEMTVDFRENPPTLPHVTILNSTVSSVDSFKFLGTRKWTSHMAQQWLCWLCQLRKFSLPQELLVIFYTAIIQSVLCTSITVWFGSAIKQNRNSLKRTIRSAEKIVGADLLPIQDLYSSRVRNQAGLITADPSHPRHKLFRLLPSGRTIVLLHGLPKLLQDLNFCLCKQPGCSTLRLLVPISYLRSPTSQPDCRGVSMFGAVVVGIGTAGWVRIRDMLAPLPGSPAEKLGIKGFISRRNLDPQQGVSPISVEEAVSREDIQVAFICTENASHEDSVRTFLQAGKHVCVEYPMTTTYNAAVELWDLAQEKGVVLHEEHIELLTEDYKWLKKEVEGKTLQEGTLHFTGGTLKPGFGFPSFSGIARLTWLVELFGELSVTTATLEEGSGNCSKMTAQLLTSNNRPLTWIEERGPGLPRAKNINFQFDSCTLNQIPPAPRGATGLFMQDSIHFAAKLVGQISTVELQREKVRILHCLELAEKIQKLCQS
ncbi:biliverdin reductase A isoform X1 [Echeneis naucrates]|nr:biliverdin reductase A isoform X1 [Echeneis naucrates]XP_029380697.1 biliverdin reductase A isoform X1 [Echeneis naucrates]XP_029380698.1 biliverdin reductase A isoform X1 [Echeneis naucrates]